MSKEYRKRKILTGYAIDLRKKYGLPYRHLFKYAKWEKTKNVIKNKKWVEE